MTTLADYRKNRDLYPRRAEILIDSQVQGWLANVPPRVWEELMRPGKATGQRIGQIVPVIEGTRIGIHYPPFGPVGYLHDQRAQRLIGLDRGPNRGLEAAVSIVPMELLKPKWRTTGQPGRVRYLIQRATLLDENDPRLQPRRDYRARVIKEEARRVERQQAVRLQVAVQRRVRAEQAERASRAAEQQERQGRLL